MFKITPVSTPMPHNLSRNERRMFRLYPHLFEDVQCVGRGSEGCGYAGGISGSGCPTCGGMLLCKKSREEAAQMVADVMAFKFGEGVETEKEAHHEG